MAKNVTGLLKQPAWQAERHALRDLLLRNGLSETVKWNKLCYMAHGGNIALIYGLKDFCAIGFLRGALLEDPEARLVSPGPHSDHMRMLTFRSLAEITETTPVIETYIQSAIAAQKAGRKVERSKPSAPDYPEELRTALAGEPAFAQAFEALTPGRRRGYLLHFAGAKQAATRNGRIVKWHDAILAGKGLHDR